MTLLCAWCFFSLLHKSIRSSGLAAGHDRLRFSTITSLRSWHGHVCTHWKPVPLHPCTLCPSFSSHPLGWLHALFVCEAWEKRMLAQDSGEGGMCPNASASLFPRGQGQRYIHPPSLDAMKKSTKGKFLSRRAIPIRRESGRSRCSLLRGLNR